MDTAVLYGAILRGPVAGLINQCSEASSSMLDREVTVQTLC